MVGKHILVLLLLTAPLASAQWVDDDDNDAHESLGTVEAPHGRAGATELHGVDVEETETHLDFTVHHGSMPDQHVPFFDSTYYEMTFLRGTAEYSLSVSKIVSIDGTNINHDAILYGPQGYVAHLSLETADTSFVVSVPRSLLIDEFGSEPGEGDTLEGFSIASDSQSVGYICVMTCTAGGPYTQDVAPNDGTATYTFTMGLGQEGLLRLDSPAPMRWSNGEATTFVYEVNVINLASHDETVSFSVHDVPDGWTVGRIADLEIAGSDAQAIAFAVDVPGSHQHGEAPKFRLEATSSTGIGRILMGVHYPAIPQPTGHHSEIYIHTWTAPSNPIQNVLYTAVGSDLSTLAFMNTVEDYEYDEGVRVGGHKGELMLPLSEENPDNDVGIVHEWAIPLDPSLQVGLLTDPKAIGEGLVNLEFDVPVGEVDISGRVAVMHRSDFDNEFNFDPEEGDTVATLEPLSRKPITNQVVLDFEVHPESIRVPFSRDNHLVLYLQAAVYRPDSIIGPNTGVFLTGGSFTLPLREHHDVVSAELAATLQEQEALIEDVQEPQSEEPEAKPTPVLGPAGLLTALAVASRFARPRP